MSQITKWTPFNFACRLRSLQHGTLNVGNTLQNKTHLYNLAVAEANAAAVWAKWSSADNRSAHIAANLYLNVPLVPGYTAAPHL